jgi:hypothetical protein
MILPPVCHWLKRLFSRKAGRKNDAIRPRQQRKTKHKIKRVFFEMP